MHCSEFISQYFPTIHISIGPNQLTSQNLLTQQTKINLKFHSELTAAKYYAELKFQSHKYLVGGQKEKTKCPVGALSFEQFVLFEHSSEGIFCVHVVRIEPTHVFSQQPTKNNPNGYILRRKFVPCFPHPRLFVPLRTRTHIVLRRHTKTFSGSIYIHTQL